MNIVQITPGAGAMFCGGCFRDNALVAAWRELGHSVLMMPLYLPLTLDEPDQSAGAPIFFSGVNVYLEQKFSWFRHAPVWLHRLFGSSALLKMAAKQAGKTHPKDLGEITVSMLRGEEGNQAREIEPMIDWLKTNDKPDVISLSNALLIGMARRLKAELKVPICCSLQGEDYFLNLLPEPHRERAWQTLAERARDIDLFIAPSHYFAKLMSERMGVPLARIKVVANGLNLEGYAPAAADKRDQNSPPVLGYFARMCPEKGLHTLVDTFILLKKRSEFGQLRLKIGGGCGLGDEPFVAKMRSRLSAAGVLDQVQFFPNLSKADKQAFLKSLTVFCTPALYGEAYGLYVIEAMAAGVPIVAPRHGGFPEILESSRGGIIADASPEALADGIGELLNNPERARFLGQQGQKFVFEQLSVATVAGAMAEIFRQAKGGCNCISAESLARRR